MENKIVNVNINSIKAYLSLFDGIFDLTEMEKKVLSNFIKVSIYIKNQGLEDNPFDTRWRKKVSDWMGRDDYNTLNTYIMKLKNKKAISTVEEGYEINKVLMPQGEDRLIFRINHNG